MPSHFAFEHPRKYIKVPVASLLSHEFAPPVHLHSQLLQNALHKQSVRTRWLVQPSKPPLNKHPALATLFRSRHIRRTSLRRNHCANKINIRILPYSPRYFKLQRHRPRVSNVPERHVRSIFDHNHQEKWRSCGTN